VALAGGAALEGRVAAAAGFGEAGGRGAPSAAPAAAPAADLADALAAAQAEAAKWKGLHAQLVAAAAASLGE